VEVVVVEVVVEVMMWVTVEETVPVSWERPVDVLVEYLHESKLQWWWESTVEPKND
jgi:hypothetical protein